MIWISKKSDFFQKLVLFEENESHNRINEVKWKKLRTHKTKYKLLIIVFLIATPIYISQYTRRNNDLVKEINLLSSEYV